MICIPKLHFAYLPSDTPALAWRGPDGQLHVMVNAAIPARQRLTAVRTLVGQLGDRHHRGDEGNGGVTLPLPIFLAADAVRRTVMRYPTAITARRGVAILATIPAKVTAIGGTLPSPLARPPVTPATARSGVTAT
ncbi:hypothetical protein DP939_02115 [Spongiactinospora rosea]|uniref:Uncharacterized protein n=2 Tax=Spongiactinospora rosea TaxID=2248750 RepID=A0A366M5P7_9ACTN|nr:hypothetical protein DP939_02115 [Spongiactinospora rosea]